MMSPELLQRLVFESEDQILLFLVGFPRFIRTKSLSKLKIPIISQQSTLLNCVCGLFTFKTRNFTFNLYLKTLPFTFPHRFLEATVAGLGATQPPSVRISAVRAVFCFCEHLKDTDNTSVLQPFLAAMMDGMLSICNMYSAEVLALVLETMHIVLQVRAIILLSLSLFVWVSWGFF